MNCKITLIDGTFDLISCISDISYDNDIVLDYVDIDGGIR